MSTTEPVTRLWGGRFKSAPSDALKVLSRTDPTFFRLSPYDIAGSRVHARELQRVGILGDEELKQIIVTLDEMERDFLAGILVPSIEDEDVHTFLERTLTIRLPAIGGKLRAGRSRNDQAANDLRLYLRDKVRKLARAVNELQAALIDQAKQHTKTPVAGFTHLQPAQPISFGHQLLAHAQAIYRDVDRLVDWDRRTARSPLGAAALAGSAICRHPELAATELGYDAPCENSIDAVAARDHVAEFVFVASMLAVNLSRLSEEVILWTSRQFRWVELDDGYATGSSIMPQKKNPDIAEITRGKAGRLLGNLTGLLAALKSLPLAYNRDLAQDKTAAFDCVDTLEVVLPAMSGMIRTMRVNADEMRRQAPLGFTLATEVADWLAVQGVPFSEAHEITGALVQACEKNGIELEQVSVGLLAEVDRRLKPEVLNRITLDAAIAARTGHGGTSPERVAEQLTRLRAAIEKQLVWAADYKGPSC